MSNPTPSPDRRSVIVAGAALLGTAALPGAAAAADEGLAPAADLLGKTRAFLSGLEPDKRKAASFAWNGSEWRGWNYFGVGGLRQTGPAARADERGAEGRRLGRARRGLVAGGRRQGARTSCCCRTSWRRAATAPASVRRSASRLSVFGTPAETGAWGFRCEGHHLTQSVAVRDNRIVSVTPSSFSAIPNRVKSGPHTGLNTLKDEEGLARRLMADLSPKLQGRARIGDSTPYNILSYAGRERANAKKVGLPASELSSAQRDLLWQMIELYSVEHFPAQLSAAQRARVQSGDRQAVHFAWYGPNTPENGVRLSRDRRRLRHRDGVGRRRGAAPAHDLPRSRQRAGADGLAPSWRPMRRVEADRFGGSPARQERGGCRPITIATRWDLATTGSMASRPVFVIVGRDDMYLMLKQVADARLDRRRIEASASNSCDVYFWTSDVDALHAEFVRRGARITDGLYLQDYGCKEFAVEDIDGYEIRFGQVVAEDRAI